MRRAIVCLAITGLLAGCHTMRFELEQKPDAREVHQRKSYFVSGLFPTRVVDVREKCPSGVVALREETTFLDGLFSLLTLSIWSPRSTTYYCHTEQGGVQ
jgi:hypothetical protein